MPLGNGLVGRPVPSMYFVHRFAAEASRMLLSHVGKFDVPFNREICEKRLLEDVSDMVARYRVAVRGSAKVAMSGSGLTRAHNQLKYY